MESLIEGYNKFHDTVFRRHRNLYKRLASGQSPQDMIIACCDSRVEPALIFSSRPGDIFVLRNIANLVPPYAPDSYHHGTSAALEFAVKSLKVKNIVILGHSGCGGVKALLENKQGEFLGPWMQIADEARQHALNLSGELTSEEIQQRCEHENILISLRNLHSYPWILDGMKDYGLRLHGLYFDIENAELSVVNEKSGIMTLVTAPPEAC